MAKTNNKNKNSIDDYKNRLTSPIGWVRIGKKESSKKKKSK